MKRKPSSKEAGPPYAGGMGWWTVGLMMGFTFVVLGGLMYVVWRGLGLYEFAPSAAVGALKADD